MLDKDLVSYIEHFIFPKYDSLYAHGLLHIKYVINHSFIIARDYDVNLNMVYCIACYHDLGLLSVDMNREDHAVESGKILANDYHLKKFFDAKQIEIMRQAVEDHSGSLNRRPRNIYGEIVSDADRDVDIYTLAKRQLPTSIKYYPELVTFEEHFERCYQYILNRNKYKFNLWTKNLDILKMMDRFRCDFLDKDFAKEVYKDEWNYIEKEGLKEKFISFYED